MIKLWRWFFQAVLFLALTGGVAGQEICDNGIDDDGDLLVDLNDEEDCPCAGADIASFIPNPDFESNNCCPQFPSELTCADDWVQATFASSDYLHTCGFWHDNIPLPLPEGGEGITGGLFLTSAHESLGACLLSPLLSGTSYTLSMDVAGTVVEPLSGFGGLMDNAFAPIAVTVYALAECPEWPIQTWGCPVPDGWTEIGSALYTIDNQWQDVAITLEPGFDVEAIIIGPPCEYADPGPPVNQSDPFAYFYFDNLILNESSAFAGTAEEEPQTFCASQQILLAPSEWDDGATQWYQDGVALLGQTGLNLNWGALGLTATEFQARHFFSDGTCETTTFVVSDLELPSAAFGPLDASGCSPLQVTFAANEVTGQAVSYSWEMGEGETTATDSEVTHEFELPGTYTVTLVATNSDGCSDSTSTTVEVFPNPDAGFEVGAQDNGIAVAITDLSTGADTWQYSFPDGTVSNLAEPDFTFTEYGSFLIEQVVQNAFACTDTARLTVNLEASTAVFVPNAFTPDQDGINDVFIPEWSGFELRDYALRIWDRWGAVIFETKDPNRGWLGDVNGGNHFAMDGIYTWELVMFPAHLAEPMRLTGSVSLVR